MDEEEFFSDEEFYQDEAEERFNDIERKRSNMKSRYRSAQNAETGATISCPYCSKLFVKKTYNKMFCSNARTKGKINCKDKYWNFADEKRRERATDRMNK